MKNDALWNHVKVKYKILLFHNFLVNALRTGLIHPSLERPHSMANLPVPYEIKDNYKNNFMRGSFFHTLKTAIKYDMYFFTQYLHKQQPGSNFRSSRLEVFYKKDVLKSFTKFTGKHQYQSLFFNKVIGLNLQLF